MVTSNKDAAKIWAEIEKARNVTPKEERGANDLERRIDDLMAINKKHQQQNGDLIKDNLFYKKKAEHYEIMSKQLKEDNKKLARQINDQIERIRKGI